ncbi:unnamed protein product [Rhizophagus irregularis]|nr:unnamed protein product [Rhizophagus irregularis]
MEYADSGTLQNYLKENFERLTWDDKLNLAFQLSCGVSCLHDEEIIHHDLHPKNILIHQNTLKLADLGGLRETPVADTPKDYIKIYTSCWDIEPDNRPTINQVISVITDIINIITKNDEISNDDDVEMKEISDDDNVEINEISNDDNIEIIDVNYDIGNQMVDVNYDMDYEMVDVNYEMVDEMVDVNYEDDVNYENHDITEDIEDREVVVDDDHVDEIIDRLSN